MTLPIQVGPSTITMNRDDRFVVCQPDGRIERQAEEGFFARDTRFVSGYDLVLNGRRPLLLNTSPVQFYSSRFEFTNPELLDRDGVVPRHSLAIRLDRTVSGGVHEDYDIVNYGRRPVRLTIEIELESDFADIFDVKAGQLVRRGQINAPLVPLGARAPDDLRAPRLRPRAGHPGETVRQRRRSTPTAGSCSSPRSRRRASGTPACCGCR